MTRISLVARSIVIGSLLLGAARAEAMPRSIYDVPVRLQDETGTAVTFEQWRGRHVAVAMGYTTCQRICPVFTLKILRQIEGAYRDASPPLELVFVTLDPRTDTPPVLAAYKERQGLTSPHWHFVTGPIHDIERVARVLGATFVDADGHIRHSLKIVVFAPTGEAEHVFDWDHRDVDAVLHGR